MKDRPNSESKQKIPPESKKTLNLKLMNYGPTSGTNPFEDEGSVACCIAVGLITCYARVRLRLLSLLTTCSAMVLSVRGERRREKGEVGLSSLRFTREEGDGVGEKGKWETGEERENET